MNTLVYLDNINRFILSLLEYLFLNNYIFFNVLICLNYVNKIIKSKINLSYIINI